jgi:hypothetical protein
MSQDPIFTAIAKLREEIADLRGEIGASEKRLREDLIGMINVGNENIFNRLTAVEGEIRNLRSEHSVTRDLVAALPATVLGAIEKPFLRRLTDLENRISKIEDKAP